MADSLLSIAEERAKAYGALESLRLNRRRRLVFYFSLAFAAVVGFEGAFIGAAVTFTWTELLTKTTLLWCAGIGLALSFVLLVALVYLQTRVDEAEALVPADFLFRLRSLESDSELSRNRALQYATWLNFQNEIERSVMEFEIAVSSQLERATINPALASSISEGVDRHFLGVLDQVVETIEAYRCDLFNYEVSDEEFYFFDIFELRQNDTEWLLKVVARRKSETAVTHDRMWPIGVGEVGDCIYESKTILRDKSSRASVRQNRQWEQTDDVYFRRRMSTPIRATDNRPYKSYGAICITSSNSARLRDYEMVFVENLSQPIATLFERREKALKALAAHSVFDSAIQQLSLHSPPGAGNADGETSLVQ